MSDLETAIKLRTEKKHDEALAVLSALLVVAPKDPNVHYHYAWTCDAAGRESDAVPHYEAALDGGLPGDDRRSAFLGLGSTYRCLGQHEKSLAVFDRALVEFSDDRALKVFRALTHYNLGRHADAIGALVVQLVETTDDKHIQNYSRALLFYADKLDERWT